MNNPSELSKITAQIERVSKIYADAFSIERDGNWFILKLQEELGELIQSYLMMTGQARKKGKTDQEIRAEFEKEAADVLCQALLLVKHYNIDIDRVIKEKWLVYAKDE